GKKIKYSDSSIFTKVDDHVRKRRRPRTKAFRVHMKDEIEKALCSRLSPLHHITFTTDENGRLSAPLDDVVASLGLDGDKYRALSRTALIKLGDISTLFTVDYLSDIRPRLYINDTKINSDTTTVYVDNLPRSCDLISLYRRAATFGSVVSLHPLFVSKRSHHRRSSFANHQSPSSSAAQLPSADQHVQAAFIQFVEQRSANNFCEDNLPRSCDLISLYRRAATFGSVVSLHPLFVSKRSHHRRSSFANHQSPSSSAAQLPSADQHVQAAFIQFVEQRSANNFCEISRRAKHRNAVGCFQAYSRNWPVRNVCKRRKIRKAKRSITGKRRCRAKTMAKQNVTAELKNSRKRKRTSDVGDEASPLKRSRSCLDISECSNNVDVQRRETEDEELCSPTSDIKVVCHANEGNSVIIPTGNVIMHHARNRRKTFKELRMKYLLLKKESFKKLKADLACVKIPMNFIDEHGKNRRKKRGRARLMSRVSRLREWHDESMQSSSSTSLVGEADGNSRKSDHELPKIVDGHELH
uniref:HTH La-type RNA-binding domain-containing protein n=1 Tax=Ascaris lumbricoides TaxID=6252 RepID=A0A0M3I973_ASCLU